MALTSISRVRALVRSRTPGRASVLAMARRASVCGAGLTAPAPSRPAHQPAGRRRRRAATSARSQRPAASRGAGRRRGEWRACCPTRPARRAARPCRRLRGGGGVCHLRAPFGCRKCVLSGQTGQWLNCAIRTFLRFKLFIAGQILGQIGQPLEPPVVNLRQDGHEPVQQAGALGFSRRGR